MKYSEQQLADLAKRLSPQIEPFEIDPMFRPPEVKINLPGHLQQITDVLDKRVTGALEEQAKVLEDQAKSLAAQAKTQREINDLLAAEAVQRAKDDKKYFWLGVLTSFVISMLVEHGSALIQLLQGLLPG